MDFLLFLQNLRAVTGGVLDTFFLATRYLGENVITCLFIAWVYWCIDKRMGQVMAFNVSISSWMNQWIKRWFKIERPWIRSEKIKPVQAAIDDATGYAMPAGNTQRAFASWGVYGFKTKVKIRRILCYLVVFLVAFSGNYLGTNTFFDEAVALILGFIILALVELILIWVDKSPTHSYRDIIVALSLCVIFLIPLFVIGRLSNVGTAIGFIAGWLLERRFVDFKEPVGFKDATLRLIPGLAFVWTFFNYGSMIFSVIVPQGYEGFAENLLVCFFISFLYPLIFTKWESGERRRVVAGFFTTIFLIAIVILAMKYQKYIAISSSNCKIIADGGYSSISPKNTIPSYENAMDIGTDMISVDIQPTHDNQVVAYSDRTLYDNTGLVGHVDWYNLDVLRKLDVTGSFSGGDSSIAYYDCIRNYSGLSMPTLAEALKCLKPDAAIVYIRIHDYSKAYERNGKVNTEYLDNIMKAVEKKNMQQEVIFAADDYRMLDYISKKDERYRVSYVTTFTDADYLLNNCPAQYYELPYHMLDRETVDNFHSMETKCIASYIDNPISMKEASAVGIDGIITPKPGIARVVIKESYEFMADSYIDSICVPTLYDELTKSDYKNYVMQGITKVRDYVIVSAYDCTKKKNSILYVINSENRLVRIIDLGFKAHLGGIAYDESRDLMWMTAARGQVYAVDWSVLAATDTLKIVYEFDAKLYNESGQHVASFLALNNDKIYVGSYCIGKTALLNEYKVSELLLNDDREPVPNLVYSIPEKIQGVTFRNSKNGNTTMILTQCNGFENSHLLRKRMVKGELDFSNPRNSESISGMVEQPLMTDEGLYLLFESSAKVYRAIYRVPNDQIWLVEY